MIVGSHWAMAKTVFGLRGHENLLSVVVVDNAGIVLRHQELGVVINHWRDLGHPLLASRTIVEAPHLFRTQNSSWTVGLQLAHLHWWCLPPRAAMTNYRHCWMVLARILYVRPVYSPRNETRHLQWSVVVPVSERHGPHWGQWPEYHIHMGDFLWRRACL